MTALERQKVGSDLVSFTGELIPQIQRPEVNAVRWIRLDTQAVFEQRADANAMKTTSRVPRANVLGVGVDAINLGQATQLILEAVASESERLCRCHWCSRRE